MTLFEKLLKMKEYQEQLDKLPEDERKEILAALKQLTERWENLILKPLQNLK